MDKKDFEKWNEQMYKKHGNENRYDHPNFLIRYNSKKRVAQITFLLDSTPRDDIIDLGCGSGYVLRNIKEYRSMLGVDISTSALKEAKKFLKGRENVRIVKGDVQNFRLRKKFDKIVCAEVIEHVPEPKELVDTAIRLSKKNTDIVITVPNEDLIEFIYKVFKFFRIHKIFGGVTIKMDWHLHDFNLKKFKKLIKNKLDIVEVKKNPFWFFPLSYVVKCRAKQKKKK